jgi:hypothetical protein
MTALATASRDLLSPPNRLEVPFPQPLASPDRVTVLDRTRAKRATTFDHAPPRPLPAPQPVGVRVPRVAKEVEVKIAANRAEWKAAFQLVASNYRARGYEAPSAKRYRFTSHHALAETTTFVAMHQGQVVTTFSLVPDNTLLGLPMESIYGQEIQEGRQRGRRMGEVTSLADSGLGVREFLQVFTSIIKLMFQYHVGHGGDTWVITVNPRHRSFYTKVLGFEPLGPCRAYASVQDAPAEAYLLDRDIMRANAPKMHEEIFGDPLPAAALAGPPVPADLARLFGEDSTQTDLAQVQAVLDYQGHYGSPRRW